MPVGILLPTASRLRVCVVLPCTHCACGLPLLPTDQLAADGGVLQVGASSATTSTPTRLQWLRSVGSRWFGLGASSPAVSVRRGLSVHVG
jgi:hypothetical protein